jgi:hypothetical protein
MLALDPQHRAFNVGVFIASPALKASSDPVAGENGFEHIGTFKLPSFPFIAAVFTAHFCFFSTLISVRTHSIVRLHRGQTGFFPLSVSIHRPPASSPTNWLQVGHW